MYFQQKINFWLILYIDMGNITCVSRMFSSHRFWRCSLFRFLKPFKYLCNFLPAFCFGWQHFLHLCFLLIIITRQVGLICSIFSNEVFLVFVEILSSCFCLVSSECYAYLSVDHSLVYVHPELLLLICQSNLGPGLRMH